MKNIFPWVLGIPKSLIFNFYYLPFKEAMRMPFRVSSNVHIVSLGKRDSVHLSPESKVVIGSKGSFDLGAKRKTFWQIGKNGKVDFLGNCIISRGSQIISNGHISFGRNFSCNANCVINSSSNIDFGDGCLIGWNTEILDGDGHQMYRGGQKKDSSKPINIGKHVWIASNATILKGCRIPSNSVVSSRACITKKFDEENILLGGFNKILQHNISWEK